MDIKVSIIIPTYNRGRLLRQCLDAVLMQQEAPPFEVVVVNDGSTDETAEVIKEYANVRLISQTNAGPAAARNNGAAQARGEIVVFTDDDCIPEPDWLKQLVAPFGRPEVAGAKGAYYCDQREPIARFVQLEYEEKYKELERHEYIDFVDTYSAAFRRNLFLAADGYDTAFTTASVEDQEFSFRLANAGHKMVFVPEARVWHRHTTTLGSYCRKKYKIGFWKVLVLAKNPNKASGDSHTPITLKIQILLAAAFLPLSALALLIPSASLVLFALVFTFFASSVPLTLRCLRADPLVGLFAPLFIVCRAGSLAWGLARGTLKRISGDPRFRVGDRPPQAE
ncbi:glycosyltransferase [Halochromatium glycolicum]|nr:glycosyltransferase [Halochromatium glycolicum]